MMAPSDIHKQIRQLEIRTRRLVNENLGGKYLSIFKGHGVEFDEVREYQPGDDIRAIDWNITAKMGTPYIKRFKEERQLNVILAVDVSTSGLFGTAEKYKQELAVEIGAALTFSAITNHDRVGLVLFTDRIEKHIPQKRGRQHALRLIHDLMSFQPTGTATDIAIALGYLNHTFKKRSIIFLISDFLVHSDQPDELKSYQRALKITNKHHDLIAVAVSDPLEHQIPITGILTLEDAERNYFARIDTGDKRWQNAFSKRISEHYRQRDMAFGAARIDCIDLKTGSDFISPLMAFFQSRGQRRRT
jgi:uncharacterized protein (DUF58 family)